MASGQTIRDLQRKLRDLQQQRHCRKESSQEHRALGTVVPTMRSTGVRSPLIPSRVSHYSHRSGPEQACMTTVTGGNLDNYVATMRSLTKPGEEAKAHDREVLHAAAAETVHLGRSHGQPHPEFLQLGRAAPVVSLPPSPLTPDPWHTEGIQAFPIKPPTGFLPCSAAPHSLDSYFQRDPAVSMESPVQREVMWPLPGYPAVITDSPAVPSSHQYPSYLPLQPHPLYRLDSYSYKKLPLHSSELSAFSPLHPLHLPVDSFGTRLPVYGAGHCDDDANWSRRTRGAGTCRTKPEVKLVSDMGLDLFAHHRKDRKGWRKVRGVRISSRKDDKEDRGLEDGHHVWKLHPWPWVSLPHIHRGQPQHLSKDHQNANTSPPAWGKLRDGLNRQQSDQSTIQVDSGSCGKDPLTVPQNSLDVLDLSPRSRLIKYMDGCKLIGCCASECKNPSVHQGADTPPSSQADKKIAMLSATGPKQDHRSARSSSMPNLLLTHSLHPHPKRLKITVAEGTKVDILVEDSESGKISPRKSTNFSPGASRERHPGPDQLTSNMSLESPWPPERSKRSAQGKGDSAGSCALLPGVCGHGVDGAESSLLLQHVQPAPAGEKPEQDRKKQLLAEGADVLQDEPEKIRSATLSPGAPQSQVGQHDERKSLFFTSLKLKPQTGTESSGCDKDPPRDSPASTEQNGGSILDQSASSLSSEGEAVDVCPDHSAMKRPRWQSIEDVMETYRCYSEERTFEEQVLQEQLRLSKEKNTELNLVAKHLSERVQALKVFKARLKREQKDTEASLTCLRNCLTLD